jgi:hypothetical protein
MADETRKELLGQIRDRCSRLPPERVRNVAEFADWCEREELLSAGRVRFEGVEIPLSSTPLQRSYLKVQTIHLAEIEAFCKERGIEYEKV